MSDKGRKKSPEEMVAHFYKTKNLFHLDYASSPIGSEYSSVLRKVAGILAKELRRDPEVIKKEVEAMEKDRERMGNARFEIEQKEILEESEAKVIAEKIIKDSNINQ